MHPAPPHGQAHATGARRPCRCDGLPSCPFRQFFVSFVEIFEGPIWRSKADYQESFLTGIRGMDEDKGKGVF